MHRDDFQQLADVRIAEAKLLLDNGMYDGAYYLAGYAVECALKACIAKRTGQFDFPPKPRFVQDCYTHVVETLVRSAGLAAERDADTASDPAFDGNWGVVTKWSEESRYERKTEADARALFDAITNAVNGVLQWIKVRW